MSLSHAEVAPHAALRGFRLIVQARGLNRVRVCRGVIVLNSKIDVRRLIELLFFHADITDRHLDRSEVKECQHA
ncbi:hypothetical protein VTI74DRAFT_9803 [Chaetomium olivicolor]